jgi:hypothetical protein
MDIAVLMASSKSGHLLIMLFCDLLTRSYLALLATNPSDAFSLSSSRARVMAGWRTSAKSTL